MIPAGPSSILHFQSPSVADQTCTIPRPSSTQSTYWESGDQETARKDIYGREIGRYAMEREHDGQSFAARVQRMQWDSLREASPTLCNSHSDMLSRQE